MRVLVVFDSISSIGGGSQKCVLIWVKNLIKLGVPVKLLCNENSVISQYGIDKKNTIMLRKINLGFLATGYSLSTSLSKDVKSAIDEFNPDILHFHEPSWPALLLLRYTQHKKIKVMTSFHTDLRRVKVNQFPMSLFLRENGIFNRIALWAQDKMFQRSDCITTPSHNSQALIDKKFHYKLRFLPDPVGEEFFAEKTPHPVDKPAKIITLSRLSGEKHIDVLIRMMQFLPDFHLTVSGDGIDKENLQNLTKQLHLEENITFSGWLEKRKVPELIRQHDLFASASDFETFGITYIEALACRLPCVVYDYPVSREVVPSNMAVFVKDLLPETWSRDFMQFRSNADLYGKLQENINQNFDKIYQYHEIESTKELVNVYNEVL